MDQEKEIEITPAEKEQIRANVREKVRQDPDRKTKAKESASRRRIEDLKFHQKMLQQRGAEEQNPLTSEEKKQALQQYNSYYKSYVHTQMNRMDVLSDWNPQEAIRQESDMLRASARSQERNQGRMSSTEEPGLGSKLATAFLDWYNLEYIVPQKPNYLSKDQSEDTQYSRYFIEQFIISGQKDETESNLLWGVFGIGVAIVAVCLAAPTMGLSVYLASFTGVATLATFAHGTTQVAVSFLKYDQLVEGNYHTPEYDKWQKGLDISGTAIAVIDLGMLAKAGGRGLANLANDTKRAEMLTKIKNPALKQGLSKVGTKLGQAGKMATGALDDAKSAFSIGKTGQLGLEGAGAGGKIGKTGSRAVDGAETWYSNGGRGTSQAVKGNENLIATAMEKAVDKLPPYKRSPNKPRNYKSKVKNEDGTIEYTFTSKKNGKEYKILYDSEGFPIFNAISEITLPKKLYLEPDGIQFEYLSNQLYKKITADAELAKKFTQTEIDMLKNGKVPKTLTWHHHQATGKMQIVNYFEHQVAGHTGGRAIWGGGLNGRNGKIKKKILEELGLDG